MTKQETIVAVGAGFGVCIAVVLILGVELRKYVALSVTQAEKIRVLEENCRNLTTQIRQLQARTGGPTPPVRAPTPPLNSEASVFRSVTTTTRLVVPPTSQQPAPAAPKKPRMKRVSRFARMTGDGED